MAPQKEICLGSPKEFQSVLMVQEVYQAIPAILRGSLGLILPLSVE